MNRRRYLTYIKQKTGFKSGQLSTKYEMAFQRVQPQPQQEKGGGVLLVSYIFQCVCKQFQEFLEKCGQVLLLNGCFALVEVNLSKFSDVQSPQV